MALVTLKSTVWPCATGPAGEASTAALNGGWLLKVTVLSPQVQFTAVIVWSRPADALCALVIFATWRRRMADDGGPTSPCARTLMNERTTATPASAVMIGLLPRFVLGVSELTI